MNNLRRTHLAGLLIACAIAVALLASASALAAFPGTNGHVVYATGGYLHTVKPDGTGDAALNSGVASNGALWPAYSADGSKLVYEYQGQTWTRPADGTGTASQVTHDTQTSGVTPAISRDGNLIAFIHLDASNQRQVWTIHSDGSGETQITSDNNEHLDPAFSPVANRIAYAVGPAGQSHDLHVMNYDGSNDVTIANTSGASDPDFSPDGSTIVYGSGGDIYTVPADGSANPKDIDTNVGLDNDPVYSPDGTKIAFDRGNTQIWTMNADGTNQTKIADWVGVSSAADPSWQPIATPDTSIDSKPPADTNDSTPTFTYHSDLTSGVSFECSVDGSSFSSCPADGYTPSAALGDASHTFQVRAVHTVQGISVTDPTPAEFDFTVDTSAPTTSIVQPSPVPGSTVPTSTPAFYFQANEENVTFSCSVDLGAFAPCTSGGTIGPLTDGSHSFSVRATDDAGNVDPSAPLESFSVDTTAPQTTITNGTHSPTNRAHPRFFFTADDPQATFECRVDGGDWVACASPFNTPTLADGSHLFEVRATDAVGNADATPASRTIVIDTTPPKTRIVSGPGRTVHSRSVAFKFASNESPAKFRCKLDQGAFRPCPATKRYTRLAFGKHAVRVEAIDAAGNNDPTPALAQFTVAR